MIWKSQVILSKSYCRNDSLNRPITISEGPFVPECAQYSEQKI